MSNTKQSTTGARADVENDFDRWAVLKHDLHKKLIHGVDHSVLRNIDEAQLRRELKMGAEELCRYQPDLLSISDRKRLIDELVDEMLGFGPLEHLLRDNTISDILINGPKNVFVERQGVMSKTPITFNDNDHLLATVQKIVARVGRRVDESSPMVDARLADGSRINVIIHPLALDGALVSIRRSVAKPLTIEDLLANHSITLEMIYFLIACIQSRISILISGGTGSGKTTLLNMLSGFIAPNERLITIEDAAELRLNQPHVARLETRPPNLEGIGEVTARDLVRNALRMRPDRIIIGECRGGEAFDMLQAMNTGHEGSMTTLHANNAQDALTRLGMLVGIAGFELPMWHINKQIASAIQIVVQVERLDGGVRKITQIAEIDGVDGNEVTLRDVFKFHQEGLDEHGRAFGSFSNMLFEPKIAKKIQSRGISFELGQQSSVAMPEKIASPSDQRNSSQRNAQADHSHSSHHPKTTKASHAPPQN